MDQAQLGGPRLVSPRSDRDVLLPLASILTMSYDNAAYDNAAALERVPSRQRHASRQTRKTVRPRTNRTRKITTKM